MRFFAVAFIFAILAMFGAVHSAVDSENPNCESEYEPICGEYKDGHRETFRNWCYLLETGGVVYQYNGPCQVSNGHSGVL